MRKKLKEWCEKYSFDKEGQNRNEKLFRNKQVLVKYEHGSFMSECDWYRAKIISFDANELIEFAFSFSIFFQLIRAVHFVML